MALGLGRASGDAIDSGLRTRGRSLSPAGECAGTSERARYLHRPGLEARQTWKVRETFPLPKAQFVLSVAICPFS